MLELADETDSKSVVSDGVWVRVPPPAPNKKQAQKSLFFYFSIKWDSKPEREQGVKKTVR